MVPCGARVACGVYSARLNSLANRGWHKKGLSSARESSKKNINSTARSKNISDLTIKAIFLGASRGCGLYAVLHLLRDPAHESTLLLRNPETFSADPDVQAYFGENPAARDRVRLVEGDAFKPEDFARLFVEAGGAEVELVFNSIGG